MEGHAPPPELKLDDLRALKVLGRGAMGTVLLAHDAQSDPAARNPFALKVVDRSAPQALPDAERRARWEVEVLARLSSAGARHPFLPHLIGTAEAGDVLCWAVPYCPGGDLNVLRYRQTDRVFSPAAIRFYVAEIVCALEHLHARGIAYRDLKPENVLIQQSGHVTLTDFDLSRHLLRKPPKPDALPPDPLPPPTPPPSSRRNRRNLTRLFRISVAAETNNRGCGGGAGGFVMRKAKSARVSPVSRRRPSFDAGGGERSNSFVGTEEYVSPEVVRGDGHEFAVDWWALGVLTYEMLYGTTPFKGKNRKETFRNVVSRPPEFIGRRTSLTDLIARLLEKDPTRRLGYARGAAEVKAHPFFSGVRWDLLADVLRPPFIASRDWDDPADRPPAKVISAGTDVREFLRSLQAPPSLPPSPPPSPPRDHRSAGLSLAEFPF